MIRGKYPVGVVKSATSYQVKGFQFSPAFKNGYWDGRKHLFHQPSASMPSGLVKAVVGALVAHDEKAKIRVFDEREQGAPATADRGFELEGIDFGKGKYDFQMEAAEAMVRLKRCILKAATNSGKSEIACAITRHLSVPTVFIVPGIDLLRQAHKRFAKRLGLDPETIGFIGEGRWEVGEWITVASIDTLFSRLDKDKKQFLETAKRWELLFMDECHSTGSDTHYAVADAIPAYYRFGLSGTPLDRSDGADLRLIAQMGEVGYEVTNKTLIERGISVQPYIEMVKITEPKLPPKTPWATVNKVGIVENQHLNSKVVEKTIEHVGEGRRVMVMVDKIKHGQILSKLLDNTDVSYRFLSGKESGDTREDCLHRFTHGELDCLIVTTIFDQGVDTPAIDVLIFAGGGKAKIRSLQRIGRGLRTGEGKDRLTVIDFAHLSHKYLAKHSMERLATYRDEDCFMISTAQ